MRVKKTYNKSLLGEGTITPTVARVGPVFLRDREKTFANERNWRAAHVVAGKLLNLLRIALCDTSGKCRFKMVDRN